MGNSVIDGSETASEQNLIARNKIAEAKFTSNGSMMLELKPLTETECIDVLVAKKKAPFAAMQDPELISKAFPFHFPYNRGHPGEPRRRQVSFASCVMTYFYRSNRIYAEDREFLFTCINMVERMKMYRSINMHIDWNPRSHQSIANVTKDQVLACYDQRTSEIGGKTTPQNASPNALFQAISATTKSYSASPSNSTDGKRLVQGIKLKKGAIHLMITGSINEKTASIQMYMQGTFGTKRIGFFEEDLLALSDSDRAKLVGKDPVFCAQYFDEVVRFTIKYIIGIDPDNGRTFAQGGAFGKIDTYFLNVESQSRLTLHFHGLLWSYDLPSTYRLYDDLIGVNKLGSSDFSTTPENEKYREVICRWADSIVSTGIPLSTRNLPCPNCKKTLPNGHTPLKDKEKFEAYVFKSMPPTHSAPGILQCELCKTDISPQNFLQFAINEGIERYFDGMEFIYYPFLTSFRYNLQS